MTKKGQTTNKKYFGLEKNKFILILSAIIFIVSLGGASMVDLLIQDKSASGQLKQAYVTVDFGNYSKVSKSMDINETDNAYVLFSRLATVTEDFVGDSLIITQVSTENQSKSAAYPYLWAFYVNDKLMFDNPESYKPQHGDYIVLKYEIDQFYIPASTNTSTDNTTAEDEAGTVTQV